MMGMSFKILKRSLNRQTSINYFSMIEKEFNDVNKKNVDGIADHRDILNGIC